MKPSDYSEKNFEQALLDQISMGTSHTQNKLRFIVATLEDGYISEETVAEKLLVELRKISSGLPEGIPIELLLPLPSVAASSLSTFLTALRRLFARSWHVGYLRLNLKEGVGQLLILRSCGHLRSKTAHSWSSCHTTRTLTNLLGPVVISSTSMRNRHKMSG